MRSSRHQARPSLRAAQLDKDMVGKLEAARPALDALLEPRCIAVVGASAEPGALSGLLFGNLAASHFAGPVLPVNKKHPVVQGVAAYPDLSSCPVVPDLVIVCVPAPAVAPVVAEAGELGVKAACVISAGFAETGPAGTQQGVAVCSEEHRAGSHGA